jgi:transglutaminase-like putative cysteine protease
MKLNITVEIEYYAFTAGTIILNIHPSKNTRQHIISENFQTEPFINLESLTVQNNQLTRFELLEGNQVKVGYQALVENHYQFNDYQNIAETAIINLPPDVLPYLYPSRYCQSDKLFRFAANLFGAYINPFEKVCAISNWIFNNILYISGSSNTQTTALDTITERAGVCRDFAHLGIALCRALTIPARYFTGYALQLQPPDFHACFEAYIGNNWVLFDATRLVPLNGMVNIANGVDAADTAVANIFGGINFISMNVACELAEDADVPFLYYYDAYSGLSYI